MLFAPRHLASEHPTCEGKHDGNFPHKARCMTSYRQGNTYEHIETEFKVIGQDAFSLSKFIFVSLSCTEGYKGPKKRLGSLAQRPSQLCHR